MTKNPQSKTWRVWMLVEKNDADMLRYWNSNTNICAFFDLVSAVRAKNGNERIVRGYLFDYDPRPATGRRAIATRIQAARRRAEKGKQK